MREKYMLALANLINGSELGYEDRSSIPQYKKDIEDYVDRLEDKNKKYEEVIDKVYTRLEYFLIGNSKYQSSQEEFIKLLNILKEVE